MLLPSVNSCSEKLNTKKGVWEKVPGTIPKDAEEAVVPKLKEGEDYKFKVMAENENGTSEPLETERPVKAKNPFGKIDHVGNGFIHINT